MQRAERGEHAHKSVTDGALSSVGKWFLIFFQRSWMVSWIDQIIMKRTLLAKLHAATGETQQVSAELYSKAVLTTPNLARYGCVA